jgi:hypothetical protein
MWYVDTYLAQLCHRMEIWKLSCIEFLQLLRDAGCELFADLTASQRTFTIQLFKTRSISKQDVGWNKKLCRLLCLCFVRFDVTFSHFKPLDSLVRARMSYVALEVLTIFG